MAAGLYQIQAGDLLYATMLAQAEKGLSEGWVYDQTISTSTGAISTNATRTTGTAFTVVGDATGFYVPGRRIKVAHAGGTTYAEVLSAVFAAGSTTVTITNPTSGPTTMTGTISQVGVGPSYIGTTGIGNDPMLPAGWSIHLQGIS